MNSIEQAREALARIAELTPARANARDARDLHLTVKAIAEVALASLSPTTPVDGVGAEPVAWRFKWRGDNPWTVTDTVPSSADIAGGPAVVEPLYAMPLANPEAEARLRERVAALEKLVAYHRQSNCEAMSRAAKAEARLAQAEGGPAVTEVERGLRALMTGEFSSLTIGFNDHHACNYVNAKGWQEQFGGYGGGEGALIEWASEEERQKAIDENSVWTIQWYPNTPVGFNCVGASTLAAALEAALHPQSAAGEEGK